MVNIRIPGQPTTITQEQDPLRQQSTAERPTDKSVAQSVHIDSDNTRDREGNYSLRRRYTSATALYSHSVAPALSTTAYYAEYSDGRNLVSIYWHAQSQQCVLRLSGYKPFPIWADSSICLYSVRLAEQYIAYIQSQDSYVTNRQNGILIFRTQNWTPCFQDWNRAEPNPKVDFIIECDV